jgi:hypothetical protein
VENVCAASTSGSILAPNFSTFNTSPSVTDTWSYNGPSVSSTSAPSYEPSPPGTQSSLNSAYPFNFSSGGGGSVYTYPMLQPQDSFLISASLPSMRTPSEYSIPANSSLGVDYNQQNSQESVEYQDDMMVAPEEREFVDDDSLHNDIKPEIKAAEAAAGEAAFVTLPPFLN